MAMKKEKKPAPAPPEGWKGREMWRQALPKLGRPYDFPTGPDLLAAWVDYFKYNDTNPVYKVDAIRSGDRVGELVYVPIKRPYSETGFCAFHGKGINFIRQLELNIIGKDDDNSKELSLVLTWARNLCYADKIDGATAGVYNPIIVARDLGLKEKTENTGKDDAPLFPALILKMPEGMDINLPSNTDGEGEPE